MIVKLLCENANTTENVILGTSELCLQRRSLKWNYKNNKCNTCYKY